MVVWPVVAAASACPVFVSNDHGDALEEWLRASAQAPLAILHVDAHNDLNVPEAAVGHGTAQALWRNSTTHERLLTAHADLANFQLTAVHAGLVDRIVWVRQSAHAGDAPILHSVHKLRFDAEAAGFEDDEVLLVTSPRDADAEAAALRSADEGGTAYAFHEVPEHELEERSAEVAALFPPSAPWILDLDLDFFAHGDARPGRAPWAVPARRFAHAECAALLHNCRRWAAAACDADELEALEAALPHFEAAARAADGAHIATGTGTADALGALEGGGRTAAWREAAEPTAEPPGAAHSRLDGQACAAALARLTHRLPAPADGARTHAAERALAVAQRAEPRPVHSAAALRAQMGRLEALLRRMGAPPAAVTLARSVDGYTRLYDAAAFEAEALRALGRVWGGAWGLPPGAVPCARYAAGTATLDAVQELQRTEAEGRRDAPECENSES